MTNTNIYYDMTDPTFGTVTPASSSKINISSVTLTLSEKMNACRVKYTAQTGFGTETIGAEHIYNLSGAELTTLTEQTFGVSGLVDNNTYNLTVSGTDQAGNLATDVENTNIEL